MTPVEVAVLLTLLVVIALALTALALRPPHRSTDQVIAAQINKATERLGQRIQHHAEVSAVLALTQKFKDNPHLTANLATYSRQVVAAALLTRINALGNDIKFAQEQLSYQRQSVARGFTTREASFTSLSLQLAALQEELLAANEVVARFGDLHHV